MKKNSRTFVITAAIAVTLVGAIGLANWKFTRPGGNPSTPFILLSEGFTDDKIMDEDSALKIIEEAIVKSGLNNSKQELNSSRTDTVLGHTYYRFQQTYMGYPVYGKSAVVAADENGNALLMTGNISSVSEPVGLKPKVTSEEVVASVKDYIINNFDCNDRAQIDVVPFDSDALIIYPENGTSKLSYVIEACFKSEYEPGYYELIVSAETGEVLQTSPLLYEAVGYMASDTDRENGFPVFESDSGYYLWDINEDFYVLNLNNQDSKYYLKDIWNRYLKDEHGNNFPIYQWSKAEFVVSDNEVFGDTRSEKDKDYESGARLLINTRFVADFFKKLGFQRNNRLYLYYRDNYDDGNNGQGGMFANSGIISMGTNTGVDKIDVLAHEFTHYVSVNIVNWSGKNQTDSINEAVSDIFGEIIESQYSKAEIDWKFSNLRNIRTPDGNCISDYADYTDTLDCHDASTLISHAAYLMWNGIDGAGAFEPLNTEELAKLFYETLYVLPQNCTFSQFRTLIQNVAEYQNLSDRQKRCVSNAFFQVGISLTDMPADMNHFAVQVYGTGGLPYINYTLCVRHGENEETYSGEEINEKGIVFPEAGEYQLTFTDNAESSNQTVVTVLAVERGGSQEMPVFTSFGVKRSDGPIEEPTGETAETEKPDSVPPYKDTTEISLYLEDYEQLTDILDMQMTDYWQFPDSNSYVKDQFYLEWLNHTCSMKNKGNPDIKLYGSDIGDNIAQFDNALQENGWINTYSNDEFYEYIAIIKNVRYIADIYVDKNRNVNSWYLNNWPEGEGVEEAFLQLEKERIGELSKEQLEHIRKVLEVPDDLPVDTVQSEPYYWTGTGQWVIPVAFYYQEKLVAGVKANAYTGEPLADYLMYSPPDTPASQPAQLEAYSDEELCEMARAYYAARNSYVPAGIQVESTDGNMVRIQIYESMEDHIATYDWYTVDRYTAEGEDFLGDPINLKNP